MPQVKRCHSGRLTHLDGTAGPCDTGEVQSWKTFQAPHSCFFDPIRQMFREAALNWRQHNHVCSFAQTCSHSQFYRTTKAERKSQILASVIVVRLLNSYIFSDCVNASLCDIIAYTFYS